MPCICYKEHRFTDDAAEVVRQAQLITAEYLAAGYVLTLRQLYYQFVRRDLFPKDWADPNTGSTNNEKSYGKLGSYVNQARLAGLIDWASITDRTREVHTLAHWETPADIVRSAADQYRIDKWADQPRYVEVWVEKDALIDIVGKACKPLDVAFFSCRGYVSQSAMWEAAQRFEGFLQKGREPVIFHLGDHDPSGIDMSRDMGDRLEMFGVDGEPVRRIALTMEQVRASGAPPNPAKVTDSRCAGYVERFGDESWELDALEPQDIERVITDAVLSVRDEARWAAKVRRENAERRLLKDTVKIIRRRLDGGK